MYSWIDVLLLTFDCNNYDYLSEIYAVLSLCSPLVHWALLKLFNYKI